MNVRLVITRRTPGSVVIDAVSDRFELQIAGEGYIRGMGSSEDWITCLSCGRTSYNANDVTNRYCGHCHRFHEEGAYEPG